MLIGIGIDQLRVGMYVHSVDLAWFRHPFWRNRFLLETHEDLERLRDAGAQSVVIDTAKGLDVPVSGIAHERQESEARRPAVGNARKRRNSAPPADDFSNPYAAGRETPKRLTGRARRTEIRRATKTLNRSKTAVMTMFADARMGKAIKTKGISKLVEQISASVSEDASIILNIARLKTKDEYTFLHSVSVCALMINLAR